MREKYTIQRQSIHVWHPVLSSLAVVMVQPGGEQPGNCSPQFVFKTMCSCYAKQQVTNISLPRKSTGCGPRCNESCAGQLFLESRKTWQVFFLFFISCRRKTAWKILGSSSARTRLETSGAKRSAASLKKTSMKMTSCCLTRTQRWCTLEKIFRRMCWMQQTLCTFFVQEKAENNFYFVT